MSCNCRSYYRRTGEHVPDCPARRRFNWGCVAALAFAAASWFVVWLIVKAVLRGG